MNTIQIKRSNVPNKVPSAENVNVGEFALNTADKRLYIGVTGGALEIISAEALDKQPRAIQAQHTFAPTADAAPFALGGHAQGQLVAGLNADQLDGHDATYFQPVLGYTAENAADKGASNGYAPLVNGVVPSEFLPPTAITDTFVVASQAAMLALQAETGDVAVRTDVSRSYILQGGDASVLADWRELLTPTDAVLSVNGKAGAVSLTTADVPEGGALYFTQARARNAVSAAGNNLAYDAATGALSLGANLAGVTATATELNSLAGVTGNVQTQINGKMGSTQCVMMDATLTTSSTSQQVASYVPIANYRGLDVTLQSVVGSDVMIAKYLVVHDGSTAYATTYGVAGSANNRPTVAFDIADGLLRLLITPATSATMTVRMNGFIFLP